MLGVTVMTHCHFLQLASLLEIFYDPLFKKVTVFSDLHWSKDCRIQVLHLLHQKPSALRELNLACYKSPHYRFILLRLEPSSSNRLNF